MVKQYNGFYFNYKHLITTAGYQLFQGYRVSYYSTKEKMFDNSHCTSHIKINLWSSLEYCVPVCRP